MAVLVAWVVLLGRPSAVDSGKSGDAGAAALGAGILQLNVESEGELRRLSAVAASMGRTAEIAIRVNPDVDAGTLAKISTGKAENKFGVPLDRVEALVGKREAAPFVALAAVFLILSLGPRLHVGAHTFGFSAPYEWASAVLPWLKIDRTPARHAVVALVCMVALAGYGFAELRRRLPDRARTLAALASVLVVLEFNQAPLPLNQYPIPEFVETVRTDPVFGSVLDLPYLPDLKRFAGIYQVHHGKPLAFQLTSRIDDPGYQAGALFRWLDQPAIWTVLDGPERDSALAELRAEMARRKLRYIVAYPKFIEPGNLAGLEIVLDAIGPHEVLRKDTVYWVYRYSVP